MVVHNLRSTHNKLAQMSSLLTREGADAPLYGRVYVEVVQAVMLYRSDTWVMTPHIGRSLGGSHHRVDRRLMGRQPWRGWYSGWMYPPLESTMAETLLLEVETYFSRLQTTVAQFIVTRTIMYLCLVVERRTGSRLANWWYEQEGLDL